MPANRSKREPVSLFQPRSYFEVLPLNEIFPSPAQATEIEIGCGSGSFLVDYAEQNPDTNFLGIERLLGRIRKLDRKIQRRALCNVRVLRVEAGYAVQYLLPPKSIDAYHIYFPDPWPKKKHWKNRLVAPGLIPILMASLKPKGMVYLRTDNQGYFEQMLETFESAKQFRPINAPDSLTTIETDFEKTFHEQGIPTLRAQYQLSSS